MQTAIIVTLEDGSEVLVTIQGIHIVADDYTLEDGSEVLVTIQGIHIVADDYSIQAATRSNSFNTWGIPLPVEVRNEGKEGA